MAAPLARPAATVPAVARCGAHKCESSSSLRWRQAAFPMAKPGVAPMAARRMEAGHRSASTCWPPSPVSCCHMTRRGPSMPQALPVFGQVEAPETTVIATTEAAFPARLQQAVVGLGTRGGTMVSYVAASGLLPRCKFWAMNTDVQALHAAAVDHHLQLGGGLTLGLGTGGDGALGFKAAASSVDDVRDALAGAQVVFLLTGAGGGTGGGAAPVVALCAKEAGALTVAAVTRPFTFEGARRAAQASEQVAALQDVADLLIVVEQDRLLGSTGALPLAEASLTADVAALDAVYAVSSALETGRDIIAVGPGSELDSLNSSQLVEILAGLGKVAVGSGKATNAKAAVERAIFESPFLDGCVAGTKGVILCVLSGHVILDSDEQEAVWMLQRLAGSQAKLICCSIEGDHPSHTFAATLLVGLAANTVLPSPAQAASMLEVPQNRREPNGQGSLSAPTTQSEVGVTATSLKEVSLSLGMAAEDSRDPQEAAPLQPVQAEAMVCLDGCNEEGVIANASLDASRKRALGRKRQGVVAGQWKQAVQSWKADPRQDFVGPRTDHPVGRNFAAAKSYEAERDSMHKAEERRQNPQDRGTLEMAQERPMQEPQVRFKPRGAKRRLQVALELDRDTCQRQLLEMHFKGGKYKGYTRGRVPDGQGELSLPDGSRYKGEWLDGAKDGIGQLWEANGDVVCGTWKQDLQHGEGLVRYHWGDTLSASFSMGQVHGKGKYTFANGSSYIGEFQNNVRHGIGFYTSSDGARWMEEWRLGKRVSTSQVD
eukprot:SM000118S25597  [mRNA]  locus=s118:225528:231134:- [translate_table: standard]